MQNKIIATSISQPLGRTKVAVPQLRLDLNGIIGEKYRGKHSRQVSILSQEILAQFNANKKVNFKPGELGENITISGLDMLAAAPLDRLQSGKVILELTQVGKKCHGKECDIFRQVGTCALQKGLAFARVLYGGIIKPNATYKYFPKVMQILIITLSDRAVQGVYEDRSGPVAKELITKFFAQSKWQRFSMQNILLPDNRMQLKTTLQQAIKDKVDFVFTLGGTGIGPRDITPEVILQLADKTIPGIMEHVRIKYGAQKPAALLGRSVAAIAKNTQIYAVPGSVRAVTEYLTEILPVLEHAIYMLHGIDVH